MKRKKIELHTFNSDVFTDGTKQEIDRIWRLDKCNCISFVGAGEKKFIEYITSRFEPLKVVGFVTSTKTKVYYTLGETNEDD